MASQVCMGKTSSSAHSLSVWSSSRARASRTSSSRAASGAPSGELAALAPQELPGAREPHREGGDADLDHVEPGRGQQPAELLTARPGERRTHQRRRSQARVPLRRPDEGGEGRVVVDGPPDGQGQPSTRGEDPPRLTKGERRVGNELQPLLAADDVEGTVGQRQGGGVGAVPLDPDREAGGGRGGDLEHALVHVRAGHDTAGPDPGRGPAGHDPGAAGHVEHACSLLDPGQVEELGRGTGRTGPARGIARRRRAQIPVAEIPC
jgi:hypothetical protein